MGKDTFWIASLAKSLDRSSNLVYMLWFCFILGSNIIFLCFKLIIIYYHRPKQKKIKLNHNIYTLLRSRESQNLEINYSVVNF